MRVRSPSPEAALLTGLTKWGKACQAVGITWTRSQKQEAENGFLRGLAGARCSLRQGGSLSLAGVQTLCPLSGVSNTKRVGWSCSTRTFSCLLEPCRGPGCTGHNSPSQGGTRSVGCSVFACPSYGTQVHATRIPMSGTEGGLGTGWGGSVYPNMHTPPLPSRS